MEEPLDGTIAAQAGRYRGQAEHTRLYLEKYGFHLNAEMIYAVEPLKAFAWSERDFPGCATRWMMRP